MRLRPVLAVWAVAALLGCLVLASAQSKSASSDEASPSARKQAQREFAAARRAEQNGDWAQAFDRYSQALADWPANRDYQLRESLARFHLTQDRVTAAERDAAAGHLEAARQEFAAALALEPGYPLVLQRLGEIERMMAHQPAGAGSGIRLETLPQVHPAHGVRDFDYRGDTEGIFQEIARQFGVSATFDPDLPHRQVRFHVNGVDFQTALRLADQMTGTFWRPLGPKLFFVAANTPQKQQEYAPTVVQTLLLSASETPSEMEEATRTIRDITGLNRTQLNVAAHSLEVRGTPGQVALAAALAREIEQPRGEILLELDVLEVDRNLARQLGITPPTSATVYTVSPAQLQQAQQSAQGLIDVITQIFGQPSSLAGLGATQAQALLQAGQLSASSLIPPLVAFGGGRTTFFATLPGAVAQLAESLDLVRSGQHVMLRAEDGQPATFFVGDRYPVSFASLSSTLANTALTPSVSSSSFPTSIFPTGMKPSAAVAADFNGDTFPDLAVANQADNTVSILLNNGSGSFSAGQVLSVPPSPVALAVGDFNGDGKPDLAVVSNSSKLVSIFLGNGDGTFILSRQLAVDADPVAIVAADFKNNGHRDLAVANSGANTISILLGNGDGTFLPQFEIPVGATPVALATADFNRDGFADLAVVNQGDRDVRILLGLGDGTFRSNGSFSTGATPTGVVAADFNGDTLPDLAVCNQADNTVSLLLGNGDGTFQPKLDFPTGSGPSAIVAADFDIDGSPDVATADENGNQVTVLLNNGQGNLSTVLNFAVGNSPDALVTADFDKNGRPDLAAANQVDNTVSVILNDLSLTPGSGTAVAQLPYPGFQYVDLGLKVTMTPRLHPEGEVTLDLKLEINGLTPQAVNGIPVLTSRSIEQSVRLKDGQPTLLASVLEPQESLTITGWPGLPQLGSRNGQNQDTELVIIARPRLIRMHQHHAKTIYAGIGPAHP